MSQMKRTVGLTLILLGAGCASAPPQQLKDARSAYQRASQGPAKELAPAQLHAAQGSLALAEKTFEYEGDSKNAKDRAYVAMRKAELAELQARISSDTLQAEQQEEAVRRQKYASMQQDLHQTKQQLDAELQRRQEAEDAQQRALASLGEVRKDPRGTVITIPGSKSFASGKATLLPAAKKNQAQVGMALQQGNTDSKIIVEGHTDAKGEPEKNQMLSQRRAEAVRQALVSSGVPPERIEIAGYGASRPLADNSSSSGRAANRRVEIVVQPTQTAKANAGTPNRAF